MPLSLNLPINTSWKSTLQNAFSFLRRVRFLVESDFEGWVDFEPNLNFQGMTTSAYTLAGSRYLPVGKTLFFHLDFSVTLAAPLAQSITFEIPNIIAADTGAQHGACFINNAVLFESGHWIIATNANTFTIARPGVAAFTAVASRFFMNGFIEIK